tara:strand:- start:1014 stop:1166 length:153 start_codon:yes stop_codon:yes gene_type:complete
METKYLIFKKVDEQTRKQNNKKLLYWFGLGFFIYMVITFFAAFTIPYLLK